MYHFILKDKHESPDLMYSLLYIQSYAENLLI